MQYRFRFVVYFRLQSSGGSLLFSYVSNDGMNSQSSSIEIREARMVFASSKPVHAFIMLYSFTKTFLQ